MKNKILLCVLVVMSTLTLGAKNYIYDLRSFKVNDMPLYLTAPDKAASLLGEPLKREGILNATPGVAMGVGVRGFYPWGGVALRYPMYMTPPQLLATMVFIYEDATIYFDQDTMYGSAFITSMSIYSPKYVLYYENKTLKVGESFDTFKDVFPVEYEKSLKKLAKKDLFDGKVRVTAGEGGLKQKGYITFVVEKGVIVAIGIVLK